MPAYMKRPETREEWLTLRRHYLGATDVVAIVGASPFRTALDVWLEKTGQREPEEEEAERAEWGRRLEDAVAQKWAELHPDVRVLRDNKIRIHPERPFLACNLDRLVVGLEGGPGILEVKTTSRRFLDRQGGVPPSWYIQVQFQMAVTGYTKAWVAALADGYRYQEFFLEADPEYGEELVRFASAWWQRHVVDGVQPQVEEKERVYEPPQTDEELRSLVYEYVDLKVQLKELEERLKELEGRLKAAGEGEVFSDAFYTLKVSRVRGTRFDQSALREAHPDVYAAFQKEYEYVRITLNERRS